MEYLAIWRKSTTDYREQRFSVLSIFSPFEKKTPAIFDLLTFLCASAGHFWLGVRAKFEHVIFLDRFRGLVTLSRARYFTGD